MQFLILAKDQESADRSAAREAHIANTNRLKEHMLYGVATLNDQGEMTGSVMVVDFPDRAAVDAWLAEEPYVTQGVWGEVSITSCQVGPSFVQ